MNSISTSASPSSAVLLRRLMSSSSDSASSIGSTTRRSMSSGSAPGYWTITSEPGKRSDGSSARGIADSAQSPVATRSANTTSVNCQRRTENDQRLIGSSGAAEDANRLVVVEPGRAFRHDALAEVEPGHDLDALAEQPAGAHRNLAGDVPLRDHEHGREPAVGLEQRAHRDDRDAAG